MELMENDVNLMRQLMALGERIEELKMLTIFAFSPSVSSSSSPNGISPTSSMISLDGVCCDINENDEDNDETIMEIQPSPKPSVPETRTPDEETESGVDGDDVEPREELNCVTVNGISPRVYFSRQNSILRIPIPPSRGFRSKTIGDLQQHAIAGVGGVIKRGHSTACETSCSSDDAASCASHVSESRGAGWYARKKAGRDLAKSGSMLSSKKQLLKVGGFEGRRSPASVSPPYHASQGSCDSGVHHLNNSVDLLDGEDLIYV